MSSEEKQWEKDYQRIEKMIHYLEEHFSRQPTLKEIANYVGLSEYHFQRLFSRWVGITPKRFLQFLTKEYAKELLKESRPILEVAYQTGLSSPGRLHDLFVNCEAMSPGEYKNQGKGIKIDYGVHASPFGTCFLATTERGICGLSFLQNSKSNEELLRLEKKWKNATFQENPSSTGEIVQQIFHVGPKKEKPITLFLRGTNFQLKVWEALLQIPAGKVVSYEDIAKLLSAPESARAVGNAVGSNPIAFLVPCHRVIRKSGDLGGYLYGLNRKKVMLGWEASQNEKTMQTIS